MGLNILIISNVAMIMEMFLVNVYATLSCSGKKKSALITWSYLVLFSAALFALIGYLIPEIALYALDDSYRLLSFTGVVYLIPLILLTKQPYKHTMVIFNTFWVYSLIIFAVSYRIAGITSIASRSLDSLVIQTAAYIITFLVLLKFMKKKMTYTFQNMKEETLNSILSLSVSVILVIYTIKYALGNSVSYLVEISIFLLLGACFAITFQLAHSFVEASKSVEMLGVKTKTDPLTRLKNREAMIEDATERIRTGHPFCLIFIDLDNFKTINDNHGHSIGDDYLIAFSNSARRLLDSKDRFYRISGDEFVVLKDGSFCKKTCTEFEDLTFLNDPTGIKFLGLSTGYANYPEDAKNISELLGIADSRMYQNKKKKHKSTFE